jgi:hypothetical protein
MFGGVPGGARFSFFGDGSDGFCAVLARGFLLPGGGCGCCGHWFVAIPSCFQFELRVKGFSAIGDEVCWNEREYRRDYILHKA